MPAQDGLAPSHTIPETIAMELTSVWEISSSLPPCSHAMPHPAAHPALTAPQNAESGPIPFFK